MYDMPDDEIIGFWGKRPFIGQAIPRPKDFKEAEPLKLPALPALNETPSQTPSPDPALPPSWHHDPTLLRHSRPDQAAAVVGEQATP